MYAFVDCGVEVRNGFYETEKVKEASECSKQKLNDPRKEIPTKKFFMITINNIIIIYIKIGW
jgi:hypothetical protein